MAQVKLQNKSENASTTPLYRETTFINILLYAPAHKPAYTTTTPTLNRLSLNIGIE